MPKSYGIDLRKKILDCYLNQEGGIRKLAKRFKVGNSTVQRILNRYAETGELKLYLTNAGRPALIDDAGKLLLKEMIAKEADLTLSEIQERYFRLRGKKPVLSVFHRVLKELKVRHKKKSHFAEQCLQKEIKKKRKIYLAIKKDER